MPPWIRIESPHAIGTSQRVFFTVLHVGAKEYIMYSIVWLVGAVVIVVFVLGALGVSR
jgi:hypothetical protein